MAKKRSCSKEGTYERLAAEEICGKYQDPQAERLSATTAMCWAAAICVCLRKKNPDMAEVNVASKLQLINSSHIHPYNKQRSASWLLSVQTYGAKLMGLSSDVQ